ncbi:ABC transporter ATP-binding protein [Natrialba swarupiae]|uniref:ATP-binding cassette domain-containing protein n=1 Tax=Natrialba swarupiae TaxID=2448032 RepID=A0A5D5AFJ4_9EURY|nr:energy-coupling factor transporter ATPase [Natrialba swarupiae]TYT60536.1 ATP-binding cassette domain-containing protein [Natrialba swarupiae]
MSLIDIDDVTFTYRTQSDDVHALENVTCSIEQGSFVGVTGPSDAGKSTFGRLIPSYIPNFFDGNLSGTVTVDGVDMRETTIGEQSMKAGMLFENPFDQLTGASTTVLEEVGYGLENLALPVDEIISRTKWSLELAGIEDLVMRNPQRLSGGQSQRVALASILAMQPEILVLDEPTSQLDPQGSEEVFRIVSNLDREEYTIVLISQDLTRLAPHLDRLIVIDDGQITHDGTPTEVLTDPTIEDRAVPVPDPVTIGQRLRSNGYVDETAPVPVSMADAVEELQPYAPTTRPAGGTTDGVTDGGAASADGLVANDVGIRMDDVVFRYNEEVEALSGVSLDLDAGCVCLIGQNGAGKTTFAKHLNGLLEPTEGQVTVGDLDTREHRVARIAQEIGLNFQNPNDQLFHNTVDEEIRYGPKNFEYNDERIDELVEDAVERLELEDVREKNPYDMGQPKRKRVAVASVIAMDTPIVVLDEPTGGQDAEGNELLGDLVESLVSDGVLVVVITHDVDFASRYADRLIALSNGEVLLDGSAREVFGQPDVLEETDVSPPIVTQIGQQLGLEKTVLTVDELFAQLERTSEASG